jgi:beta-N-acetylhexosaminidase
VKVLFFSLLLPWVLPAADLKTEIAQMLVVGFEGDDGARAVREHHVGGVILFDRNIQSPEQLRNLTDELKEIDNTLIISVDQEGGYVDRLKKSKGFPASVAAARLGRLNDPEVTRRAAATMAATLKQAGINVDFAPCADLNINPLNPVIGAVERSYSADPEVVVKHAGIVLEELQKQGIAGCLKHFPGHGSSTKDTHVSSADVTATWRPEELEPYKALARRSPMVMTSHIFNADLDPEYPATMSHRILTGMLRGQIGFRGVIITDDLAMRAMADNYPLEEILVRAINAGADMLCLSNNGGTYDPELVPRAIAIIAAAVDDGRIPRSRIDEAYNRIKKLKMLVINH